MEDAHSGGYESRSSPSNSTRGVVVSAANRVLKAKIPVERPGSKPTTPKCIELIGRSWASDSTAFVAPEFSIGLDAGYIVHGRRMENYFVTHVHTDHAHFLTHLKSRSKPPTIVLPRKSVQLAENFLGAAQQMTSNMTPQEYQEFPWKLSYKFVGVDPGERFVVNRRRGISCTVVACDHGVPCVGYIFMQVRQKLKAEYSTLTGQEIGKLRKQGVEVVSEEDQLLFAFLGDTTVAGIFSPDSPSRDEILRCPTVIIECSFLTDDNRKQAEQTKHVLWSDLKPHVQANPQTTFVLIHFSHRWSRQEVIDFFRQEENYFHNVIPWINGKDATKESLQAEEVWSHNQAGVSLPSSLCVPK